MGIGQDHHIVGQIFNLIPTVQRENITQIATTKSAAWRARAAGFELSINGHCVRHAGYDIPGRITFELASSFLRTKNLTLQNFQVQTAV